MQSHTRCGDAATSNAITNARIRHSNSAHVSDGCRQQHCIHCICENLGAICMQDKRLWIRIYPWISTENLWIWMGNLISMANLLFWDVNTGITFLGKFFIVHQQRKPVHLSAFDEVLINRSVRRLSVSKAYVKCEH